MRSLPDSYPILIDYMTRHLTLSTLSFALCFAMWGLVGAFGPVFRQTLGLSGTQAALLVVVPVLLGSLARIPAGMLTDRFGGRGIFTALMLIVAVSATIIPNVSSFEGLLAGAFLLGLAGSSFAVGVGYVSGWTTPEHQGTALGVYGLGTIGQSAAVFLGPLAAQLVGWQNVFYIGAVLLVLWAVVFAIAARNAPGRKAPTSMSVMLRLLRTERLAWALAAFYFLTFGGFVAFSVYLPLLLRDEFGLTLADAGFRTAGFVVVAAAMRPVGGWLADRIGGSRVLSGVFAGIIPFALLMSWLSIIPFTVGALGCAALLGIGNGGVFKLVPQYFPNNTGVITGLVGAMGGLGGFFPPLLLGFFRDTFGAIWPGFVLLAAVSALLWPVNSRLFLPGSHAVEAALPRHISRRATRIRAGAFATLMTGLVGAAIIVGSRNLQNFDAALVIYTFATIFMIWGVAYHYSVWLEKPPTRLYWRRTWDLLRKHRFRGAGLMAELAVTHLGLQTFIARRSRQRWWMHQLIFWGCLLAVAITFPLVFGWVHFRSAPNDQMTYVTYLFGFRVASFQIRTVLSWIVFHALDISAVMVLAGVFLAVSRRLRDRGAQAVQSFGTDFFPLILLTAISVTGLALTASTMWLRGNFYDFLAILHAITVVAGLLYLPFGKFFHIFQRPAQLGVKLYQHAGAADTGTQCARCGERFASDMHIRDLNQVLRELDFDYTIKSGTMWQNVCPPCKRKALALSQLRLKRGVYGSAAD
jgi:MFS transporter, NNP family, nitrate/nitrite transporter